MRQSRIEKVQWLFSEIKGLIFKCLEHPFGFRLESLEEKERSSKCILSIETFFWIHHHIRRQKLHRISWHLVLVSKTKLTWIYFSALKYVSALDHWRVFVCFFPQGSHLSPWTTPELCLNVRLMSDFRKSRSQKSTVYSTNPIKSDYS